MKWESRIGRSWPPSSQKSQSYPVVVGARWIIVGSDDEITPVGGIVRVTVGAELAWFSLWIMVVFGLFSLIVAFPVEFTGVHFGET
jgi:hypothetical protein